MASLIDELVLVLEREDACYTELIKLSREKSPVIVKARKGQDIRDEGYRRSHGKKG